MLVHYLRRSAAEVARCAEYVACLKPCGIEVEDACTAEQLEVCVQDAQSLGRVVFVGVSGETAPEITAWARQNQDRVAIIAGPLKEVVNQFLEPLQAEDISRVVVLIGYDKLTKQLRDKLVLLVVRHWMLAPRDLLWPLLSEHTDQPAGMSGGEGPLARHSAASFA